MALSWYLAPSLGTLRTEINQRWPARSKATDGALGDAAHSARASDHNPNDRRSVNAIDVTNDGIDVDALIDCTVRDPRTFYVISRGKIRSRTYGFVTRPYYGINGHYFHAHISIRQSASAEQDASPWGLAAAAVSGGAGSTRPGLPSTGDGPTTQPTPKEDTLSAAEVAEIKAHVTAEAAATRKVVMDQTVAIVMKGFDAKIRDAYALQIAGLVASNGLNRGPLEMIGEAAGRHAGVVVKAEAAANRALLDEIRKTGGVSEEMMARHEANTADAVREAAQEALQGVDLGVQVTTTIRDVMGDLLHDWGKDFDDAAVEAATERVVGEITERLNTVAAVTA